MKERQNLAKQFLGLTLERLKNAQKIEGFAYKWLEEIIEISYLNGFNELMKEALDLRTSHKRLGNPLAGSLSNMDFSHKKIDNSYEWPKDKRELEKKYTYNKVIAFLKICDQSDDSHLFVKHPKEVGAALNLAKNDFDLETIACSLCVNGYFTEAHKIIANELSSFAYRIRVVKTVMCIELFRRDEFEKALKILDELYPEKNDPWNNLYFARGILGYEPWGGYPFSDY